MASPVGKRSIVTPTINGVTTQSNSWEREPLTSGAGLGGGGVRGPGSKVNDEGSVVTVLPIRWWLGKAYIGHLGSRVWFSGARVNYHWAHTLESNGMKGLRRYKCVPLPPKRQVVPSVRPSFPVGALSEQGRPKNLPAQPWKGVS